MQSRLPWIIVAIAVAAALGLWLGARLYAPGAGAHPVASALVYPEPREVPAFTLARADGASLTREDLQGHWSLLFFGYTHCPDVCPTTLATLKQVQALLRAEPAAAPIKMLFVSIDPERDAPQALAQYVAFFSPDIVAATGDQDALQALTRALGVVYMKAPQAEGDYTMDHSASLLLIDPQAHLHALFRPPLEAKAIAADLRSLARG